MALVKVARILLCTHHLLFILDIQRGVFIYILNDRLSVHIFSGFLLKGLIILVQSMLELLLTLMEHKLIDADI